MKAVARTLGVARSSLEPKPVPARRRGRPPAPDDELLAQITAIIAALPTYGYRRVHALLRRQAEEEGQPSPNHKRVWRVMKAHGVVAPERSGRSGCQDGTDELPWGPVSQGSMWVDLVVVGEPSGQ